MTGRSVRAIETGEKGEQAVAEILARKGYHIQRDPLELWDLLINNCLTVEVKTAHLSGRTDKPNKRWQFCLHAHPERQQPINEHLLFLRCESKPPCHFIIPVFMVPKSLTKIDITNPDPWKYGGRWSYFRERWDLVWVMLTYREG